MEDIVAGKAVELLPGVVRITAPNPGVMTGPGTNSYIVGTQELVVIDPGPAIESHVHALLAAVGDRLRWILCTHTHLDHSPAAAALKRETGARIAGSTCAQDGRQDVDFCPDQVLTDGDEVAVSGATLGAVHTPGHVSNHLCYLLQEHNLLFTGDHVMQGSTVVISPPNGSMEAYLLSLRKLLALDITALAPGHGRVIENPQQELKRLIAHRLAREQKVVDALARTNPATVQELVPLAYDDVSEKLHAVAARSLHAHLIKLAAEGRARVAEDRWSPAAQS